MNRESLIKSVAADQLKKNVADVRVGEIIKVHYKIREGNKERIQIFEGLVTGTKRGKTIEGNFTVRKVVSGIGVERTFPLHSPWITKIERLKSGKVRRANLNFVRQFDLSSRFKLRDKGLAGASWVEPAEEKSAETPSAAEEPEVASEPEMPEDKTDDASEQGTGQDGGDAGAEPAPAAEAADSGDQSAN